MADNNIPNNEPNRPTLDDRINAKYKTDEREELLKANKSKIFHGRKVIKLPLEKEEINRETLLYLLPSVLSQHFANVTEMDYLYNYYKGKQPILNKKKIIRPEINYIVEENHAYEIVEFKKGYMFGHPIKYAQGEANDTDDIGILNKYMVDQNKEKGDMDIAEYMYTMGTAYRWVLPRKDNIDIDKEAPFRLSEADPRETFVVYSTNISKDVLFGGNLAVIDDENGIKQYILTVYTDTNVYKFNSDGVSGVSFISEDINGIGIIPVVEYALNNSRLSPIEVVMSMLDALNTISSNELDDLAQFVNSLMVFFNVDVTKEILDQVLDLGAVKLSSIDPAKPADLKILQQAISHADTQVLYERVYGKMLGILGVPKQSDSPRSSGDTGQARLLGEGWTLADQRAKVDEANFKSSDREVLRIALKICSKIKNCKLNELAPSEIDIKFNRSKGDNMLVKSQSLTNLISAGVEFETSLATVDLFSDPHEVANKSKTEQEEKKEEQQKMFEQQQNNFDENQNNVNNKANKDE